MARTGRPAKSIELHRRQGPTGRIGTPLAHPSLVYTVPFAAHEYVCPDCDAPVDLELFAIRSWRLRALRNGGRGA